MTNLIHCDGPSCHKTKRARHFYEYDWFEVNQEAAQSLHFCSRSCLAAWAQATEVAS